MAILLFVFLSFLLCISEIYNWLKGIPQFLMDQFIYWLRCQLLLDKISGCFTFWWLCGYFHVRNQKLKADWRISYFDRSIHLLVRCCQLGPTRCRKLHKRKLKCSGLEMFQVELLFIISGPTIVTSSYKGRPWVIKKIAEWRCTCLNFACRS